MDTRYKTLIIAGSIGAVLIGLMTVSVLAYRARFAAPPQETAAPSSAPAGSGTKAPTGATGGATSGTSASVPRQAGVSGVANPTPDFTQGSDGDHDRLTDQAEAVYGTDPTKIDTDGDGYGDGDEVLIYGSDPKDKTSTPATIEGHEKLNL